MRLISCHIENFGKLSDVTVSFESPSGMKILCENNGWGKSTLAIFIKVMFYGFDNEGKRNIIENERQHYKPWQGGIYGGQLTFEADNKRYILSRTFGTKDKDDEFMLQDADTKLVSTNYTKNIGGELFGIDSASFARSIYISQNDCMTETTDAINAKLGNLADNTDDLNNYNAVAKRIADSLNALSKTRKTGELYKQKERLALLKQEIKQGGAIDASMEELIKRKNERHKEYEKLKEEQSELKEKQKKISEYKDILVKRKEYEHILTRLNKAQSAFEQKKAVFPVRLPDEKEVDKYIDLEYKTSVLKKNMDSEKPDDEESRQLAVLLQKFKDGAPDIDAMEDLKSKINNMQKLERSIEKNMLTDEESNDLKRLAGLFADNEFTIDETINKIETLSGDWSLRSEKKNMLSSKRATVDMLRLTESVKNDKEKNIESGDTNRKDTSGKKASHSIGRACAAAAVIFIITALVAIFIIFNSHMVNLTGSRSINMLISAVLAAIAAAAGCVIILQANKKAGKNNSAFKAEYDQEANDAEADAVYAPKATNKSETPSIRLSNEIHKDEELINKIEADVERFFNKYGLPFEENNVIPALYRLKEDAKRYERLLEKEKNCNDSGLKEQYEKLRSEVDAFLSKYQPDAETSYVNQTYELEADIGKYGFLKNKKDNYDRDLKQYEENSKRLYAFIDEIKMNTKEVSESLSSVLHLMKTERESYLNAKTEYEEAADDKLRYETKNSDILDEIKNIKNEQEDNSLIEIEERLGVISEEIEVYHTNMAAYGRQLDELQEKRDEITEAESHMEELEEVFAQNEKRLEVLQMTQKYLEQAKISLTAKYTQPIKDGFDKYFGMLCDLESENYQLDANLKLSVIEQGMPRDIAFLSAGYKDMAGICMRMALIDAMYKEEKPFVIFDDPFVNLDAQKTQNALKLLKMIAEEYQVVYFTCNESRIANSKA